MEKTIEQLHIAAQYLAAIGISFVAKQADDSHTNLGWDGIKITTHSFGEGNFQVGFNLKSQSLEWIKNGVITNVIDLNESNHGAVLNWFSEQVNANNINEAFQYKFHYELPYEKIKVNDSFSFDSSEVLKYSQYLTTAQKAFETFLASNKLESPIRIWPHHFDLGIYTKLSNNLFLGAGLAIPDSLVDDLYYYASGWLDGNAISTKAFSGLSNGNWRSSDWDGATLPSKNINVNEVIDFLNQVKIRFLKNK